MNSINGSTKGLAAEAIDIDEVFNLFFDDILLNKIVENTNSFITENNPDGNVAPVTLNEIKAFIGLLIFTATLNKSQHKVAYLFSVRNTGNELFYTTISKMRFVFLLDSIKFDNCQAQDEEDPLGPIRSLIDSILGKCLKCFTPGSNVTIDSQFLSYIDSSDVNLMKNTKKVLKIISMIDSESLYCINMDIGIDNPSFGKDETTIMKLVHPICNSPHNITLKSEFMSLDIAEKLLEEDLTVIGELKKTETKDLAVVRTVKIEQACTFDFGNSSTLMTYAPRYSVPMILLSTHRSHNLDNFQESNSGELKSKMLDLYSETIGAVVSYERLCSRYCIGVDQQNLNLSIFFHLLNMCTINSNVIFNHNNSTQMERKMFLEELARFLVEPFLKDRQNHLYDERNYVIGPNDDLEGSDDDGEWTEKRIKKKRKLANV